MVLGWNESIPSFHFHRQAISNPGFPVLRGNDATPISNSALPFGEGLLNFRFLLSLIPPRIIKCSPSLEVQAARDSLGSSGSFRISPGAVSFHWLGSGDYRLAFPPALPGTRAVDEVKPQGGILLSVEPLISVAPTCSQLVYLLDTHSK